MGRPPMYAALIALAWLSAAVAVLAVWLAMPGGEAVQRARLLNRPPPTADQSALAMAVSLAVSAVLFGAAATVIRLLDDGSARLAAIHAELIRRRDAAPAGATNGARDFASAPLPLDPGPAFGAVRETIDGREFWRHPDGTVAIQTLTGFRRFASVAEMKDYIRAG